MKRLMNIPEVTTVSELRGYLVRALTEIDRIIELRGINNYEIVNPADTSIYFDDSTNKLKVYNKTTKEWVVINP